MIQIIETMSQALQYVVNTAAKLGPQANNDTDLTSRERNATASVQSSSNLHGRTYSLLTMRPVGDAIHEARGRPIKDMAPRIPEFHLAHLRK